MRQAHPHPYADNLNTPVDQPQSELARRLASGASVEEMMRRGEIGGQALGLIQMMAGQGDAGVGPRAYARGSVQSPVGTN